MTLRVGLYGGCFNPVHQGHLAAARGACDALELDQLIFIPSGLPPLKGDTGLADGMHRLAMLQLAIADDARLTLSTSEIDRAGPSFTVDTVRMLRANWPADADVFFLLGDDCVDRLPRWKGIEELHGMVRFAVLPRQGDSAPYDDLRLIRLALPGVAVSSTQIRQMVSAGQTPAATLLIPEVARYIQRHGLYATAEESEGV